MSGPVEKTIRVKILQSVAAPDWDYRPGTWAIPVSRARLLLRNPEVAIHAQADEPLGILNECARCGAGPTVAGGETGGRWCGNCGLWSPAGP